MMNAVDVIRLAMEDSGGWVMAFLNDTRDIPFQRPTANGGNHPLWIAGHLAYSEASLVGEWCRGQQNPLADWAPLFGMGSEPSDNPDDYPPFDDVIAKLTEVRASTMSYLDTLTDSELEQPSRAEGDLQKAFPTVGHCLIAVSNHFSFHGGQLSDCRRAAGRGVLMG